MPVLEPSEHDTQRTLREPVKASEPNIDYGNSISYSYTTQLSSLSGAEKVSSPCCREHVDRQCLALLEGSAPELNAVSPDPNPLLSVVLDSGAVEHVADNIDAPGYPVDPSQKSQQSFTAANGDTIVNRGQMTLNLTTSGV